MPRKIPLSRGWSRRAKSSILHVLAAQPLPHHLSFRKTSSARPRWQMTDIVIKPSAPQSCRRRGGRITRVKWRLSARETLRQDLRVG